MSNMITYIKALCKPAFTLGNPSLQHKLLENVMKDVDQDHSMKI